MIENPPQPPDPLVGSIIREYTNVCKIGEGGMGAVYKAYHKILKQYRALKVLRRDLLGDESFIARFLREAQTLTEVNHANVARFFEFFQQEDGTLFMAMEFVEGERLDERIKAKTRLTEKETVPIIRQVCKGIEETHRRGIIHRDISPDNIMLVRSDLHEQVKILDFGIAKNPTDPDKTSFITQVGTFIGKYRYCSPEQAQGEDEDLLDPRSDIYSLGVVMYQALTGAFPFAAQSPQAYLLKQMTEEPIPVREREPGVTCSPELASLTLRMLSRNREERPRTIQEVLKTLEEIEEGKGKKPAFTLSFPEETEEPVSTVTSGPTVKKESRAQRFLAWISSQQKILGLAFAVLLLVGTVFMVRHFLFEQLEPAAITVISIPSDAGIFIDDVLQAGKTPHTIRDIEAGEPHTLRVEKEGYAPWSREFNLESGGVRLFTATLKQP